MQLSDNQSARRKAIVNAVARMRQGVIALVALSGCLSQTASASPQISSVVFSGSAGNYTISVTGTGFGTLSTSLPFAGDTSYFRISDAAQLGAGEWGYSGDANTLTYQSWSDTQIEVSGFGGQPGDAITMALWNPTSGVGATWGGNVPGGSGTPQITSVTSSNNGQNLQIIVNGSGFGSAPVTMPFTGDLNYFGFGDFRTHCGGGSALFGAGNGGWGVVSSNSVTLKYQSWSDSQIVINGFAGSYGQGCATVQNGDPITIGIWNTSDTSQTGRQTAWGGFATETVLVEATVQETVYKASDGEITPVIINNNTLIAACTNEVGAALVAVVDESSGDLLELNVVDKCGNTLCTVATFGSAGSCQDTGVVNSKEEIVCPMSFSNATDSVSGHLISVIKLSFDKQGSLSGVSERGSGVLVNALGLPGTIKIKISGVFTPAKGCS